MIQFVNYGILFTVKFSPANWRYVNVHVYWISIKRFQYVSLSGYLLGNLNSYRNKSRSCSYKSYKLTLLARTTWCWLISQGKEKSSTCMCASEQYRAHSRACADTTYLADDATNTLRSSLFEKRFVERYMLWILFN